MKQQGGNCLCIRAAVVAPVDMDLGSRAKFMLRQGGVHSLCRLLVGPASTQHLVEPYCCLLDCGAAWEIIVFFFSRFEITFLKKFIF